MLCQTENIAPGTVANAMLGNAVAASVVANPEFCMPISKESAFFRASEDLAMVAKR